MKDLIGGLRKLKEAAQLVSEVVCSFDVSIKKCSKCHLLVQHNREEYKSCEILKAASARIANTVRHISANKSTYSGKSHE